MEEGVIPSWKPFPRFHVKAFLENKLFRALADTGANITLIGKVVSDQLNLKKMFIEPVCIDTAGDKGLSCYYYHDVTISM